MSYYSAMSGIHVKLSRVLGGLRCLSKRLLISVYGFYSVRWYIGAGCRANSLVRSLVDDIAGLIARRNECERR